MASVVPLNQRVTITDAIRLERTQEGSYHGQLTFPETQKLDEAFIWIGEVESREQIFENFDKQIIIPYTLGGSPDSHKRSHPPRHPASNDGYCQFHFPGSAWTTNLPVLVLSPHNLPKTPPDWTLASAPCYLGVPSANAHFPESVSLAIYYNRDAVKSIDDLNLRIFRWDETNQRWEQTREHRTDTVAHLISANVTDSGLYVAFAVPTSQTTLIGREQGQTSIVNVITPTQTISVAAMLSACANPIALNLSATKPERYYPSAKPYVTNLSELRSGYPYYVAVDGDCTIEIDSIQGDRAFARSDSETLNLGAAEAVTASLDILPATFYGSLQFHSASTDSHPTISVFLNDQFFAEVETNSLLNEFVYVLDIKADDKNSAEIEGGIRGQTVTFQVGCNPQKQAAQWKPGEAQEVNLTVPSCIYLPLVSR